MRIRVWSVTGRCSVAIIDDVTADHDYFLVGIDQRARIVRNRRPVVAPHINWFCLLPWPRRIACSLIYRRASANGVEAYSASDLIYRCVTVLIRIFIPRIGSIRHPPNLEIIKTPIIITANRILISRDRPAARSPECVAPNYARSSTEIYALVHDRCLRNKLVVINFVTSDSSIWPDLSSVRAKILQY
jgi:hypothetical protein